MGSLIPFLKSYDLRIANLGYKKSSMSFHLPNKVYCTCQVHFLILVKNLYFSGFMAPTLLLWKIIISTLKLNKFHGLSFLLHITFTYLRKILNMKFKVKIMANTWKTNHLRHVYLKEVCINIKFHGMDVRHSSNVVTKTGWDLKTHKYTDVMPIAHQSKIHNCNFFIPY